VLLHLHCLLFGVLGWVSVKHFVTTADVKRDLSNQWRVETAGLGQVERERNHTRSVRLNQAPICRLLQHTYRGLRQGGAGDTVAVQPHLGYYARLRLDPWLGG
jgi:hypothetical protein